MIISYLSHTNIAISINNIYIKFYNLNISHKSHILKLLQPLFVFNKLKKK